ncbi:MAG: beta-N-acetylhexosaminidase [bacterium]|nr:beta-N-acetylhexosaminidase [bacterium]
MEQLVVQALQSFLFGFRNSEIPEMKRIIKDHCIGGLIFFSENIPDLKTVKDLIKEFQSISEVPLFISLDQEGGHVRRIKEGITEMPDMSELGKENKPEKVYKLANTLARDLVKLGFNLNYAPVLDVDFYPGSDSVIGTRSFGTEPKMVAELGWMYAKGMIDAGVIPVGKHFPGHGLTSKDSHKVLPVIESDIITLGQSLLPFKIAIENEIPALMMGHLNIKNYCDDDMPATLSKTVIDQIKKDFSFKGIIISDDLPMKGITGKFSIPEASVLAYQAGCDILLISGFLKDQVEAIEKIISFVEKGKISKKRITDAYNRILNIKTKFKL